MYASLEKNSPPPAFENSQVSLLEREVASVNPVY